MLRVSQFKHPAVAELLQNSMQSSEIEPGNVYQTANMRNRSLVNQIIAPFLQPNSRYQGIGDLIELAEKAKKGESCLILMEHYSNFDLPNFFYLSEHHSHAGRAAVNQVIAMAGAKLNQESLFVRAFTEAYSRIVIVPSRTLDALRADTTTDRKAEIQKARSINMAALHEMVRRKHEGNMVLVFPAGTRYRPGDESTRQGTKEMDSYIKSFDHLLFIAIAGNTLRINPEGKMADDLLYEDTVICYSEGVESAQTFRDNLRNAAGDQDPKQVVADGVMARLAKLHAKAEEVRASLGGKD